jgi:hypothetical protein
LDLTSVQKTKLKELNNKVGHHIISGEISKELSFDRQNQNQDNNKSNKGKMQID